MRLGSSTVLEEIARQVFVEDARSRRYPIDAEEWRAATKAGLAAVAARVAQQDASGVPPEALGAMRWAAMQHLKTLVDLDEIAKALGAAGVRWLVFKGPVLADVVYRRPGLRTYGDLDVLVHPHDLEDAMIALQGISAELLDRNWQHIRKTQQSEISLLSRHGTAIDLHWHVISNPRARRDIGLPVAALLSRSIEVQLGRSIVPTMDPIDTVCYLALHAALSGGHQLRWLIDIQQAIQWAAPDRAELGQRANQLGCALVVSIMLARVARHLDPRLRALRLRLGTATLWVALCSLIDRSVTLDPGPQSYSGRVAFGSTRRNLHLSLGAAARAGWGAASSGKARRASVPDAAILRIDQGGPEDRSEWLRMARSHA